jgi:hypothetical protein
VTATFSTKDTPEEIKKRLSESAVTDTDLGNELAAPSGGLLGWLKRLFGGTDQPRA